MIKQILYNCEADCTVLIRKPQVISGGVRTPYTLPLDPPLSWKLSSTTDWLMSAWKNVSWGHPFGLLAVRWLDIGQASSRSIGSLSSDVFDCLTSTGSEPFSLLVCLNATKFVLLSVFTILETIWPKVCSKSRLKSAKSPLLVDARGSKTSLLKLRRQYTAIFNELCH